MWEGQPKVSGSSQVERMILLTCSIAGLQFAWGVEMSYVNVYLLSLGVSKSILSFIWIAGPISGLLIQPLVGILSDNCSSTLGRRRPYMIVGSVVVSLSLPAMAWAQELAEYLFGSQNDNEVAIIIAVMSILFVDMAINTVQACSRALIVDTLPASMQEIGNGWAGRMIAVGNVLGYLVGCLDLVSLFHGFIGNNQLKSMCVISSLALMVSVYITCRSVNERVLLAENGSLTSKGAFHILLSMTSTFYSAVRDLPPRIEAIFKIQFCAWYGWFTFLFYSATWVGEIFIETSSVSVTNEADAVGHIARVGSISLVVFSTVSLVASTILPEILHRNNFSQPQETRDSNLATRLASRVINLLILKPVDAFLSPAKAFVSRYHLTMVDFWLYSHLIYAVATFSSGFVTSVTQASVVIAFCGISWAITTWAPFSLLAEELHLLSIVSVVRSNRTPRSSSEKQDPPVQHNVNRNLSLTEEDFYLGEDVQTVTAGNEKSGIYLGMHNAAITIPQLISTLVSFCIYTHFTGQNSLESSHNGQISKGFGEGGRITSLTMQAGAISALMAAYYTRELKKMRTKHNFGQPEVTI